MQVSKHESTVVSSVVGDLTEDPLSEHISSEGSHDGEPDHDDQTSNDEYESRVHDEPVDLPLDLVIESKSNSPPSKQYSMVGNNIIQNYGAMGAVSDRAVITPGNESSIVNWHATKPSAVRLNSLS